MNLDEVIEVMVKAIKENKKVARVHTGDPAILELASRWIFWILMELTMKSYLEFHLFWHPLLL